MPRLGRVGLTRCGKWALHREEEVGDHEDQGVLCREELEEDLRRPDCVSVAWNREPWCEVDRGCRKGQCQEAVELAVADPRRPCDVSLAWDKRTLGYGVEVGLASVSGRQ